MKTKICKSWLSKAVGLMFSGRKKIVMIFSKEQKIALHTFFVFFPIKLEFLNSRKKIVDKTVMRPFSFYSSKKKAKFVVETPLKKASQVSSLSSLPGLLTQTLNSDFSTIRNKGT